MDQKVFFNFPNPTIVNEGPFWREAIVLRGKASGMNQMLWANMLLPHSGRKLHDLEGCGILNSNTEGSTCGFVMLLG